ncbi:hypothetical protein JCM10512_1584 [Bacteroides reticulotermitis JCM 10512]|uniref:Uncharacterized protein n=1 Tax=Bacteroides reticulotermitis JCM 10512 TaxID=1445607 RepID=W4UQ63_9BACE|nr:hypothetical protein JCM10512_1584 [Bacteroides reticulotermitis JCM 10512]
MRVETKTISSFITEKKNGKTSFFIELKNGNRLVLHTASQLHAVQQVFWFKSVMEIDVKGISK